ncbi:hypothetical protein Pla123a_47480 [Posidoniimonas polymericola]|uniref:HTH marR-type domain-containing protein n=1 Tax=Posidoniimonas polymericola TaxID=2528002 RepID=A0A5C5XTM2_9BACT|nr:MarR family transcriptional regulator [Posidoniimonas polymericola]TWT66224.1 hypothetical protein Pla123a_47480 [Posidoniimonas polymericola]
MTGHHIALSLRSAYLTMHRQTQKLLSEFGFTPFQFVLLSTLVDGDEITQRELAVRAFSDANTVRASLLILERDGVIERRAGVGDRRTLTVGVTAKGRRVHSKLSAAVKPLQEMILSSIRPDRAELLVAELDSLVECLGR